MEEILGFKFMDELSNNVATSAGLPLDQTKFVLCLLAAYPLAFVFSCLPKNNFLKHLVSTSIGVWFGWFTMRQQIFHSLISSTVVYLAVAMMPRTFAHKFVFVWMMGYMCLSHVYRMYTDYMGWSMDFTGPQMVLTIKLITFAFDYRDGLLEEKDLKPYQKLMHLKKLPSPLEFYGYVYFFCGFLAGPAFNMKEYQSFIDGSLFKDAPNSAMPSAVFASLYKFAQTLVVLVGVFLQMQYPLIYCRTSEFVEQTPFLMRIFYIWFAAVLQRFPYYFAWLLSEGSCIMAGIGYSGVKDGKVTWNRATNVKIIGLELSQSFKEVTENWNIRTDKWLKHYIYERVPSNGILLTFLTSAVWHGFYPGYYFSFITSAFIVNIARGIRRNVRPYFMEADEKTPKPTKKFYDLACLMITSLMLNYTMTPFILLGFEYSVNAWMSVYFFGHALVFVGYLITVFVRPPKKPKKEEEKKTR
jgi:hypothetical protein